MAERVYADMELIRVRTNASGTLYAVHHNGEVLVPLSRDPEHEACRAYRGNATHLRFFWKGSRKPGLIMPVEWGKTRCTRESEKFGPAVANWKPNSYYAVEGKDGDLEGGRYPCTLEGGNG
jgi:hypothetical protein